MPERLPELQEPVGELYNFAQNSGPLRLLFVAEAIPPLGEYLAEHSSTLQQCIVSDASRADEAIEIVGDTPPNLVVLQVSAGRHDAAALLDHARMSWPHTAFLAFTVTPDVSATSLIDAYGDMTGLDTPDLGSLHAVIEEEIQRLCFGAIRGVSLPNLLQMLQWEYHSVSLLIRRGEGDAWGRLHLRSGTIVDAYVHQTGESGEDAALELLSWEPAVITLERSYRNQHTVIRAPLQSLLMEAMKRRDESTRAPPTSMDAGQTGPPEEDMFFRRKAPIPTPSPATTSSPPLHEPPATTDTEVRAAPPYEVSDMSNVTATLDSALNTIDGALAAALVEYSSGMPLGKAGSGVNLDMAAAGNTEVVRAKLRTMEMLGIKGTIEDILITLDTQYHILYLIPNQPLFLYLVLSRDRANLAMARFKLKALGSEISV